MGLGRRKRPPVGWQYQRSYRSEQSGGVQPQDIEDRVSQDIEDSDWGDSGVAAGLAGGLP